MFKKTLSLLFVIVFFSVNLFAQRAITGSVTQIIDGRTVTVEAPPNQKYTVQLQYIEIPESEQPLFATVKEHLEKLLLNKSINLKLIQMTQGKWIGKIFIGDVDISQQMLRDGAAWYDLPISNLHNQTERENYQAMESAAKSEKRGVWGVEGLKPSWEFRAEQEEAKKKQIEAEAIRAREEAEKNSKNNRNAANKRIVTVSYSTLPDKILNASYIDANDSVPKGFAVIGVGYLENNKERLLKVIKKPKAGDLTCDGYEIPSPFIAAQNSISKICPTSYFGNNASYIEDAKIVSKMYARIAVDKTVLAYRMYRISGNYAEFEIKAQEAISAVGQASSFLSEGDFKNYLLLASEALRDSMLVKSSRNGVIGAKLGGSVLIALNDKYGLNDVSEYLLDREIINVGVSYINNASAEAKKLGI